MSSRAISGELPFDFPMVDQADVDSLVDRPLSDSDMLHLRTENPILHCFITRNLEHIAPQDTAKKEQVANFVANVLRLHTSAESRATLEARIQEGSSYGYTPKDRELPWLD